MRDNNKVGSVGQNINNYWSRVKGNSVPYTISLYFSVSLNVSIKRLKNLLSEVP